MEITETREEIGSRINELIFMLGLNQSTFALKIGKTQSTVRNIAKNISRPRYEFIQSVLEAFPNINKDWLMEGVGEPFPEGGPKPPTTNAKPKENNYLMEQLDAIENSFKFNIESLRSSVEEKNNIIQDQRFMIDLLKGQLSAMGKADLSEELLPVSECIIIPFNPRLEIVQNNVLHTASLTVGF